MKMGRTHIYNERRGLPLPLVEEEIVYEMSPFQMEDNSSDNCRADSDMLS